MEQANLLLDTSLPEGMRYQCDLISSFEERALLECIGGLPFHAAEYKEWHARRRIVSYGGRYDFTTNRLTPAEPIAVFLHPLRARIASWSGIPAERFNHALIAEYSPGTQLGWHRDVADFETIVGVSLAGVGRMRLRPYPPAKGRSRAAMAIDLAPRSAYVLAGAARWKWQHAISPTKALRYSITFRTTSAGSR